ncbi:MAG: hydantoinase/oxoprolinase family protein [Promethearchaeota archaeon]
MSEIQTILGLDIGGANTKAALIQIRDSNIINTVSYIEYFPFWEQTLSDIHIIFKKINTNVVESKNYSLVDIDYIAIAITAELSDAFQTKKEGILIILKALSEVYPIDKLAFISNRGIYIDYNIAFNNPLEIAAANWVSTALFLGIYEQDCILIDSGSTTIDIIPILDGRPVAKGTNDITRLMNHELIYTGGLRATIPSITHFVPYKDSMIRISFEKFALISDVHRILNNITEEEYINDTADNRSTSLEDCYARLSRIICLDLDSISKEELKDIASYIYEKQLELIQSELNLFCNELIERIPSFKTRLLFVITGLSSGFLIQEVLKTLGFEDIKNYEAITKIPDHVSSSAFAVAGALHHELLKKLS